MRESRQRVQVFLAAMAAVTALSALSHVAGLVVSHTVPIGALAVLLAAVGVWYLSPQDVKPKA